MPYRVAQRDGKYRVVKDGEVQPSIDNGGYKSKQSALDAAIKANKAQNTLGTGMADKAADALQNRNNRIQQALYKATGK